jgi:pimeloyl-ACP methyl ester carboxylesterase
VRTRRNSGGRRDRLSETRTQVAGRPVRSLTAGHRRGLPDVVLLPGLGAPSYVEPWARQISSWTRVSVLDLPGWRGLRGRGSASTVAGIAAATAGWLEAGDWRDVLLVGHSSGAQSAIRAALLVPDRLRGLVLAGPTLDPAARSPLALLARLAETLRHERLSELPAVLPWYLRSGVLPWLRLVRSAVTDKPEAVAGQLRLPVLVLTGARDRLAPPDWAARLAALAGGSCQIVPGAHNACFTDAAATDAVLRRTVLDWASRGAGGGSVG